MGLSEDLIQLVTEAKSSRKLVRPYSGELVRKLVREMNTLYRSIESGFMPESTQSLTQASSCQLTPLQLSNTQNSVSFVSFGTSSSKRSSQHDTSVKTLVYTPEAIHMQQLVYFLGLHRIKRALLIYHMLRVQTIQQQIWLTGHLPSQSAYTGVTTPRRSKEGIKRFSTPRAITNGASNGKRQLESSSSASTPKRLRDLSLRDRRSDTGSSSPLSSSSSFRQSTLLSALSHGANDVSSNLSSAEVNFGTGYQLLIGNLSAQFPLIDIMGSLEPPKEVYLEVRVIRDCGEILTDSGIISLEAGSQLFVRKADVEQLLINGDIKAI
ncbi:hypothetical protein DSO57_1036019 [Entomophthora muscae]|uniref:Uncharacterized protein n=1 Tax=Entomophthora muscae TaxID=34485 RepID=A0ACC2RQA5_9FUNG|nr:hypothetical protein DSO57_1036019 [Entomophthora muscae]